MHTATVTAMPATLYLMSSIACMCCFYVPYIKHHPACSTTNLWPHTQSMGIQDISPAHVLTCAGALRGRAAAGRGSRASSRKSAAPGRTQVERKCWAEHREYNDEGIRRSSVHQPVCAAGCMRAGGACTCSWHALLIHNWHMHVDMSLQNITSQGPRPHLCLCPPPPAVAAGGAQPPSTPWEPSCGLHAHRGQMATDNWRCQQHIKTSIWSMQSIACIALCCCHEAAPEASLGSGWLLG
jgi:hypothetical protein